MAKNISLLASRMPVRLELFLQFSFSNIVFMFLLYSVLRSINSKTSGFATKQRICGRRGVPGVGNCLFLRARGWGIDRQVRKKLQIPGGMTGGDGNR